MVISQLGQSIGWSESREYESTGSPIVDIQTRDSLIDFRSTNSADAFWQDGPPAWAVDWGEDEYGRWVDCAIADNLVQRLRWIEPGTFMMGSPESEPERSSDELQHSVTLSEGYWLAETACTQAVWKMVVGHNPSKFSDVADAPVEKVSWDDVKAVLEQLSYQLDDKDWRLPTEAEWEFACRAGSSTAFHLGDTIRADQVNSMQVKHRHWRFQDFIGDERSQLKYSYPMTAVYMKCMAMFGNGVRTGMACIRIAM